MTDEQIERAFMSESIYTTKGRLIELDDFKRLARAIEREALERAAQACEQEAADSKRHRLHEYAAGANICACNIRALIDQDKEQQ